MVHPAGGRRQEVHLLHGCWGWKEYFAPLGINVSGHVQTKGMKEHGHDAIHMFRFVRRGHLHRPVAEPLPPQRFPAEADDIILLGKHFLASPDFSQVTLFCPAAAMRGLKGRPAATPPAVLPERARQEYARAAEAIAKRPWSMLDASTFLRQLSEGVPFGGPPEVRWVFATPDDALHLGFHADALSSDDLLFVKKEPHQVTVRSSRPKCAKALPAPAARAVGRVAAAEAAPAAAAAAAEAAAVAAPAAEAAPAAVRGTLKRPAAARGGGRVTLPPQMLGQLGCPKCRRAPNGCAACRSAAGLVRVGCSEWRCRVPDGS